MKNIIILSSLILFLACKTEKPKESASLITELDSVSYSLGVNIGENIKKQFENINLDNFEAGIKDVLEKELETKISDNQAQAIINSYFSKKQKKESESMIEEGANYLQENAKKRRSHNTSKWPSI
jgi:FKBP-type peptidyl-prolyl cis-trans isomerase FklB